MVASIGTMILISDQGSRPQSAGAASIGSKPRSRRWVASRLPRGRIDEALLGVLNAARNGLTQRRIIK